MTKEELEDLASDLGIDPEDIENLCGLELASEVITQANKICTA